MRKPTNPKLYAMLVAQARAKYSTYPNPGASAWVHKKYVESGGQFVETTEVDRRKGIEKKKFEKKKQENTVTKKEVKKSKKKDK